MLTLYVPKCSTTHGRLASRPTIMKKIVELINHFNEFNFYGTIPATVTFGMGCANFGSSIMTVGLILVIKNLLLFFKKKSEKPLHDVRNFKCVYKLSNKANFSPWHVIVRKQMNSIGGKNQLCTTFVNFKSWGSMKFLLKSFQIKFLQTSSFLFLSLKGSVSMSS